MGGPGLVTASPSEQERAGYLHTLREIRQQPDTLLDTCARLIQRSAELRAWLRDVRLLILTGSGSSEYVGNSVRLGLQNRLKIPVQVVGGGVILTHGIRALLPIRPAVLVSVARSGDSPESAGALGLLLAQEPELRHLVITCNREGALSRQFAEDDRVKVVDLDPRTNDRSLVMTSSFTSLAEAVQGLGFLEDAAGYQSRAETLARAARSLADAHMPELSRVGNEKFARAVFLGSGDCFGAARECALKMLEMTAGRVATVAETYLGLRHGPMSYVHDDTLIVALLSPDASTRAYELDLLRELDRKELGMAKLIIGPEIANDVVAPRDVVIETPELLHADEDVAAIAYVVAGQVLAFFRCLREGLRPDSPSEAGVINRVVGGFELHSVPEPKQ